MTHYIFGLHLYTLTSTLTCDIKVQNSKKKKSSL